MKKLVSLCLVAFFSVLLCEMKSYAQDVIVTSDGQILLTIVTEISEDVVIYKSFDNQNGPDYKLQTSRIQKIRFSNGTEQTFTPKVVQPRPQEPSQTYDSRVEIPGGRMTYTHGDYIINGKQLYEGELRDYFNADEFETINGAMRQRSAGKGLLIAGGAIIGAGVLSIIPSAAIYLDSVACQDIDWVAYRFMYASISLMVAGNIMIAIGAPFYCVGNSRLNWAAESYNNRYQPNLSFAAGKYGPGLVFRF